MKTPVRCAWNTPYPLIPDIVVYDLEEPELQASNILGPDGEPIVYAPVDTRQGFVGFIDPKTF